MKNCLLFLTRYPYPPIGGDKVKSKNMVKILSKNFNLTIVIITDEPYNENSEDFLKKYCTKYFVYRYPKYRFLFNSIKGIIKKEPIQVSYYYFKNIKKKLYLEIENSDFIINNLIRTVKYVEDTEKIKFLDIVDSIGLHYLEAQKKSTSFLWNLVYKLEGKRVSNYEKNCIANFNNTFFVNKNESEFYSKYGNTSWIPNGVNPNLLNYKYTINNKSNKIVFFGKMNYQPNIEAVLWYIKNVHPLVKTDYEFIILGAYPSKEITKYSNKYNNIQVTGYVDDPYKIIASSTMVVSPMQIGGGIQNKVLESMALGQINILTQKVAKPITFGVSNQHFLVEDNPYKMSLLIDDILLNRDKYFRIGLNARKLIKEKYTWDNYELKLLRLINSY
ncbi:glycosyltransferase [Apibacter muscae]|uniref:Glycosyltransferase n=1 Tax=Apibacter muscae TaxID=2509004 RepID=A0A563D8Z4_9FLAO|nr:glycosyltransferase [Apibacter muscae]TWP26758.1 glycosyltransferase [Apibacter muscae]TWP27611.1 glycosyltransferase [Apibacter muscae]